MKINEEEKKIISVDVAQSSSSDISPEDDKPPTDFYYLTIFSKEEREALEIATNKSSEELEKTLIEYSVRRWMYRIAYNLANVTNLLFMIFLMNTSSEGVEKFVKTFDDDIDLPHWFYNMVGITTAVISTLLSLLTFSPEKEAYKSTIENVHIKSIKDYLLENIVELPFLLITINATAGMARVVEITEEIKPLPTPLNWMIMATIVYFSYLAFTKYLNPNYQKGVTFWKNKSLPWLYEAVREGQIAIPLQILEQSASSIGLRALNFYYLAEASNKAVGLWVPPSFVFVFSILHSACALYRTTYLFYLNDLIELKKLFDKNNLINNLTFKKYMEENKKNIVNEQGHFYLFMAEPLMTLLIAFSMAASGWLGWKIGTLLSDTPTVPVIMTVLTSLLIGNLFYQAEANRVMHKLIYQHESKIREPELKPTPKEKKRCEGLFAKTASFINVGNSCSFILTNIGTINRLIGPDSSSFLTPLSIYLSMLRGLDSLILNGPIVQNTVSTFFSRPCSSRFPALQRLFSKPRNEISPSTSETERSSILWRMG